MVVSLRTTTTEAATRPTGLKRSGVFLMWEVGSCCDPVPKLGRVVSVYVARMAGREDSGGGGCIMIPPPWRWTIVGRKMATDPGGGGFASRVSGNVRPQDPGGGAVSIVPPRRMTSDDVSNTPFQSFGGVGRGDRGWGHSRTGVSG